MVQSCLSPHWSLARSHSPSSVPLRGGGTPTMFTRGEIPRRQNLKTRLKSNSLQESFLPPFPKGGSVRCSSEPRSSWWDSFQGSISNWVTRAAGLSLLFAHTVRTHAYVHGGKQRALLSPQMLPPLNMVKGTALLSDAVMAQGPSHGVRHSPSWRLWALSVRPDCTAQHCGDALSCKGNASSMPGGQGHLSSRAKLCSHCCQHGWKCSGSTSEWQEGAQSIGGTQRYYRCLGRTSSSTSLRWCLYLISVQSPRNCRDPCHWQPTKAAKCGFWALPLVLPEKHMGQDRQGSQEATQSSSDSREETREKRVLPAMHLLGGLTAHGKGSTFPALQGSPQTSNLAWPQGTVVVLSLKPMASMSSRYWK